MEKIIIRLRNILLINTTFKKKLIIIFFISFPMNIQIANASNEEWTTDPTKFIGYFASKGIDSILASEKSNEDKTLLFRTLLNETFDIPYIAEWVIGRNWKNFTELEQSKFTKTFKEIIVITWSRRFGDYDGQSLYVEQSNIDGKNGFLVQSYIIDKNGNKINIQWRLRMRSSGLKVVDIIVEGVSMAITYRQDYNSVMRRKGGFDGLILRLEKQLNKKINKKKAAK